MPQHVCNGAVLMCSFGVAPSTLTVLPVERVMTSNQQAATVMDHQPMVNVQRFGMSITPTNPAVAAATAAALGVLTPMPCSRRTFQFLRRLPSTGLRAGFRRQYERSSSAAISRAEEQSLPTNAARPDVWARVAPGCNLG